MLFLVEEFNLFKPSTWLSAASDGVMGTILSAIRTFCFWLIEMIYRLMVNVYNLFDHLCNARILDNDILGEMSRRIGFILGLIMFFYIIFSFIQMVIDPDKITDKEKGAVSIIKKVVIVILMLALYNTFFDVLYGLQVKIVNSNVISNIILPYTVAEGDKDRFGNLLSNSLIKAFYYVDDFEEEGYIIKEPETSDYRAQCQSLTNAFYNQIYNNNAYDIGYMCLNENIEIEKLEKDGSTTTKETYIINFDGIIAILAGGFTVYILVMYCFKIGVRMIQLAFLEIISPMAIISYLTPKKDNMLSKWWKIYFSTYIDVFIRIAIINFVIFLICTILSTNNPYGTLTFWDSLGFDSLSLGEKSFYSVVIILALLTFAKKAPDLIKEIIGSSASKLGFGMAMKDIVGLKETIGMTTGAVTGAAIGLIGGIAGGGKNPLRWVTGAVGGVTGGIFRGGKAGLGAKGITKAMSSARDTQAKANIARAQRIASGSTLGERAGDATRGFFGIQSGYEKYNSDLSMSNAIKETLNGEDVIKHIREVRQSYIQSCAATGTTADVTKLAAYDKAEKEALRQMYAFAHDNDSGSTFIHIEDTSIGLNLTEEFSSNRGIFTQIKNNEKRAGRTLKTYDDKDVTVYDSTGAPTGRTIKAKDNSWKSDNNALKTKIADKTKKAK